MTIVTANDLLALATRALVGQGFSVEDARPIAEEFVVAELAGVKTHGLGKLVSLNLGDLTVEPSIGGRGALLTVDGNGGNGFSLFRSLVPRVAAASQEHGIAAAFVHNFSRYSSLYPYTDALAGRGLVGILINNAGPPAVAPHGSIDPVTGTNPICFSFPLPDGATHTLDFATSDVVWGAIRQAALEGASLPSGPFLSATGDVTTVPADVNAVRSFGGAKGFALNLAIELLAGPLAGAKAGEAIESEFDCGAALIAIDPSATGAAAAFPDAVATLLDTVRGARPVREDEPVRAPGDRGRSRTNLAETGASELDIPDATFEMLERMSSGESIAELSSNPLFN